MVETPPASPETAPVAPEVPADLLPVIEFSGTADQKKQLESLRDEVNATAVKEIVTLSLVCRDQKILHSNWATLNATSATFVEDLGTQGVETALKALGTAGDNLLVALKDKTDPAIQEGALTILKNLADLVQQHQDYLVEMDRSLNALSEDVTNGMIEGAIDHWKGRLVDSPISTILATLALAWAAKKVLNMTWGDNPIVKNGVIIGVVALSINKIVGPVINGRTLIDSMIHMAKPDGVDAMVAAAENEDSNSPVNAEAIRTMVTIGNLPFSTMLRSFTHARAQGKSEIDMGSLYRAVGKGKTLDRRLFDQRLGKGMYKELKMLVGGENDTKINAARDRYTGNPPFTLREVFVDRFREVMMEGSTASDEERASFASFADAVGIGSSIVEGTKKAAKKAYKATKDWVARTPLDGARTTELCIAMKDIQGKEFDLKVGQDGKKLEARGLTLDSTEVGKGSATKVMVTIPGEAAPFEVSLAEKANFESKLTTLAAKQLNGAGFSETPTWTRPKGWVIAAHSLPANGALGNRSAEVRVKFDDKNVPTVTVEGLEKTFATATELDTALLERDREAWVTEKMKEAEAKFSALGPMKSFFDGYLNWTDKEKSEWTALVDYKGFEVMDVYRERMLVAVLEADPAKRVILMNAADNYLTLMNDSYAATYDQMVVARQPILAASNNTIPTADFPTFTKILEDLNRTPDQIVREASVRASLQARLGEDPQLLNYGQGLVAREVRAFASTTPAPASYQLDAFSKSVAAEIGNVLFPHKSEGARVGGLDLFYRQKDLPKGLDAAMVARFRAAALAITTPPKAPPTAPTPAPTGVPTAAPTAGPSTHPAAAALAAVVQSDWRSKAYDATGLLRDPKHSTADARVTLRQSQLASEMATDTKTQPQAEAALKAFIAGQIKVEGL